MTKFDDGFKKPDEMIPPEPPPIGIEYVKDGGGGEVVLIPFLFVLVFLVFIGGC